MKASLERIRAEFRRHWQHYVFQSFLATATMAVVLIVLTLQNAVVVASLGATTFIVFAMPNNITAKPRNVIGGHLVGLVVGSLFSLIPHATQSSLIIVAAGAVGLSIFIMVVIDTEHPPAAGTALGMVISGFSWSVTIAVITAVVLFSLVHHFFRKYIKDLV